MFKWDFSKLPEHEHERVKELVRLNEWRELVDIHDQYELSQNYYCCSIGTVKYEFIQFVKSRENRESRDNPGFP